MKVKLFYLLSGFFFVSTLCAKLSEANSLLASALRVIRGRTEEEKKGGIMEEWEGRKEGRKEGKKEGRKKGRKEGGVGKEEGNKRWRSE